MIGISKSYATKHEKNTRNRKSAQNRFYEVIIWELELTPMQKLWSAVVFRAYEDMIGGDPRAVGFFRDPESNLELACSFLDWDPLRIRRIIRRHYK